MPVQVRRGALRSSFAAKVLSEARRLAKSEAWGQFPLAAQSDSEFVPLSERLGPCLPSKRAGFDSRAVLETACVDPVMPHGVARTGTSAFLLYQGEANGKPGGC